MLLSLAVSSKIGHKRHKDHIGFITFLFCGFCAFCGQSKNTFCGYPSKYTLTTFMTVPFSALFSKISFLLARFSRNRRELECLFLNVAHMDLNLRHIYDE
jgi:hypothetical protein